MHTIRGWKKAARVLEAWRKKLAPLRVTLKRARAIDATPIDFIRGEPAERAGAPKKKFGAKLIFFTPADATLRRPSGATLVVDTYEIETLSDGKTRVIP